MDNFNLGQGLARPTAESRYILPTFEERTAYGYKRQDPYAKLFEERRLCISEESFLQIDGILQHSEGVTHVMAEQITPLLCADLAAPASHDFH